MVTKRTPRPITRKARITPKMVDVYRRTCRLEGKVKFETEYYELSLQLDQHFERMPWQTAIMDARLEDEPPDYITPTNDWEGARRIVDDLDEAAEAHSQTQRA